MFYLSQKYWKKWCANKRTKTMSPIFFVNQKLGPLRWGGDWGYRKRSDSFTHSFILLFIHLKVQLKDVEIVIMWWHNVSVKLQLLNDRWWFNHTHSSVTDFSSHIHISIDSIITNLYFFLSHTGLFLLPTGWWLSYSYRCFLPLEESQNVHCHYQKCNICMIRKTCDIRHSKSNIPRHWDRAL